MSQSPALPHPYETPIEQINVSDPRLYEQDAWRPYFERLRQQDPVHYQAESAFGPFWSITRFEDIVAVDTNHEVFSSEPTIVIGDLLEETPFEMFIAMDPPKHDVQRRAAQPVVAPKNLAEMEGLIRSRVIDILDTLPVGETFDWVDRVSINLTTQMLATLFDFPFEQRHKLTYWSDIAAGSPEIAGGDVSQEERQAGLQDCLETFTRLWHEKKAQNEQQNNSRFDLISLLQKDPNTADMVDRPMELMGNLILLIVGGNDTTRNSATGGVLALNQNPAEYDKLRANHALIPGMVSEIIRWQTPLAHMRRTATRDIEFQGKQIRQGDKVVMWYLSGNRDESAIDNADQFIIDRANPRHHLSFGFGIHRCMGNRLAEMQLRILWEEIMQRFRFVEVMGEPERVKSNLVRGYKTLPVRLHPL
ncbi:cytochrome P450 [Aestuariirhabdus haliotis]|uniref:cytochrome P450 n=1 Tax=Aestuariirhabdus haliotis TaxID=2918751 RepID=UPI0020BD9803|nr:cytochrome P450 [Aestuariirhabdus haliotis]MCL6421599.1 cytochrome P450 [Aestuariirhabdus haliotis]